MPGTAVSINLVQIFHKQQRPHNRNNPCQLMIGPADDVIRPFPGLQYRSWPGHPASWSILKQQDFMIFDENTIRCRTKRQRVGSYRDRLTMRIVTDNGRHEGLKKERGQKRSPLNKYIIQGREQPEFLV